MTKSKNSATMKATTKVVAKGQEAKAAKPAPAAKPTKAKTPQAVNAVKTPQNDEQRTAKQDALAAAAAKGKTPKAPAVAKAKKIGGLDAAALVLNTKGEPMTCKAIMDEVLSKGMWKTNGKTPAATIYAAMLREITKKGDKSRFKKTDRGLFAAA